MEHEPLGLNPEETGQMLDAASIGLYVLGIRALIDPQKYPSNPLTDHAREVIETMYGVDGGYQIPSELIEIAFPSKNNLLT